MREKLDELGALISKVRLSDDEMSMHHCCLITYKTSLYILMLMKLLVCKSE